MDVSKEDLDRLTGAVLKSSKYQNISEDLIRHIGARELSIRGNVKAAVKTTKRQLHQVGGAYFETRIDYERALDELKQAASSGNRGAFREVCTKLMELHTSTNERVEILDEFYTTTLSEIEPVHSVLDIACGLNPLAIPWLSLGKDAVYYAYDVYTDLIDFIQEFLALTDVQGEAVAQDVTQTPPSREADLALILKSIPCLEHLDKEAGLRLLEEVRADHLLVSFPVQSLGGRSKGMVEHYEKMFRELVLEKPWPIRRFEFTTELVFLVTKRSN
jgi:16S rRNA (guanine(1405)-N(7))-methyltransferase